MVATESRKLELHLSITSKFLDRFVAVKCWHDFSSVLGTGTSKPHIKNCMAKRNVTCPSSPLRNPRQLLLQIPLLQPWLCSLGISHVCGFCFCGYTTDNFLLILSFILQIQYVAKTDGGHRWRDQVLYRQPRV